MDRIQLISELHASRLVAVVRSKSPEEALGLAHAAADGGVKFVEITFSVPGAVDVIKELARRGGLHVGAGTVLAPQQAERAIGAGAEFVVSPSLELNLIGLCHSANIACFPGAATPTEIIAAQRAHADLVKIFPADLAGGPYFVRQMQGPFPEARFMVSGGVSLKNVTEYVKAGVTGICLGSAYLDNLLAEQGKKRFVKEMQQFIKLVAKARKREINRKEEQEMKKLRLTLACEDYDRTRPIKDGIVKPEGLDLNCMVMPVEEIFWRMMKYEEFNVSELSMGAFLTAASRGRRPFIAIPVFPSRTFRHRCIFVNTASGVTRIEELRGKRMGVPEYSMTAAVWLRGLFEHEYGVAPSEIHWVQAGEEHPGRKDRVDFEMPAGVRMESRPDTTLNAMIESGEVDAMMSPRMPTCFLQGSPKVKRLFPNYRQVEMDYFKKTGLFPIMHVIVIKRSIYEKEPWVAQTLYKAFCAAKEICMRDLYDTNILRVSLPWTSAEYEDTRDLMTTDYWPYGVEPNRKNLETLHGYLLEQGLIKQKLNLDELFARETLEAFKI